MLDLQPGAVVDDKYKILHELGQGGMGTVFAAVESGLNRKVAIKFLHSNLLTDEEHRARFEREGRVLATLSHTNILTFYRFGIWQRLYPFIVMEFLEGKSLQSELEKSGKLEFNRSLDIAIQMCDALQTAHHHGIVHRDLKPGNVILVDSPKADHVKLVDFGLARIVADGAVSQHLTQTGELVGSVYYMSPEQCMGRKADARSDVYSLGCMIYEAVSGTPPLVADNPIGLMHKHTTESPSSLSSHLSGVEQSKDTLAALDAVLQKALAKSAEDRYQSADAFKNDLLLIRNGLPHSVSAKVGAAVPVHRINANLVALITLCGIFALSLGAATVWKQQQKSISVKSELTKVNTPTGSLHTRIIQVCRSHASPGRLAQLQDLVALSKAAKGTLSSSDIDLLYSNYLEELARDYPTMAIAESKAALLEFKKRQDLGPRAIANVKGLMCETYTSLDRWEEAEVEGKEAMRLFESWPGLCQSEVVTAIALAEALSKLNERQQALAILRQTLARMNPEKSLFCSRLSSKIALLDPSSEPELFARCCKLVASDEKELAAIELLDCWNDVLEVLPNDKMVSRIDTCLRLIAASARSANYCRSLCLASTFMISRGEFSKARKFLLQAQKLLPSEDSQKRYWLLIYSNLNKINLIERNPLDADLSKLCALSGEPDGEQELMGVMRVAIDTHQFAQADRLFSAICKDSNPPSPNARTLIDQTLVVIGALPPDQERRKVLYLKGLCRLLERARVSKYLHAVMQSELAVSLCQVGTAQEVRALLDNIEANLSTAGTETWRRSNLLVNIAVCHHFLNHDDAALTSLEKALQATNSDKELLHNLNHAGNLLIEMHQEKKATEYFERMLHLCKDNTQIEYTIAAISLSELYNKAGHPDRALRLLKSVPPIQPSTPRTETNVQSFISVYNALSTYYSHFDDFKNALAMLEVSRQLAQDAGLSYAFQLALESDCVMEMPNLTKGERARRVGALLDQAQKQISEKTAKPEQHVVKLRQGLHLLRLGKVRQSANMLNELVKEYEEYNLFELEAPRGILLAATVNLAAGDAVTAKRLAELSLKRSDTAFGANSSSAKDARNFLNSLTSR